MEKVHTRFVMSLSAGMYGKFLTADDADFTDKTRSELRPRWCCRIRTSSPSCFSVVGNANVFCSKGLAARQIENVPLEERDAIALLQNRTPNAPPAQWSFARASYVTA
jgi:hypothetical protein